MSNDISIRPSYLTGTEIQGAFAESLGFSQPARISMRDDRFNVIDENGDAVVAPSLSLDVIMLHENDTRIYYPPNTYDAERGAPPLCYSDNRVTPSERAQQPQSELCAKCVHSVWDQPTSRGNLVPACDSRYKVAVLVAGAGGSIFLLSVPPASRKAYEQYRRYLRANHANPNDVITRLGYVNKAFTFEFAGWVNEKTVEFVKKLAQTDEAALVVGAFDKPKMVAQIEGPKAVAKAIAPLTQPGFETPNPPAPVPPKQLAPDWGEASKSITPETASFVAPFPQEPAKRRGRPPKYPDGPPAGPATTASPAANVTPLPSAPGTPNPQGIYALPQQDNGQGFGMDAQKPPQDIQAALNRAFGPR